MNRDALDHAIRYIKLWLAERYEEEDVPGFVAAVSYKGEMLINEAYGYADVERGILMRPDHVFRIASHSKTFTATAIMQLAEAGCLRIDDRVVEYIPWLRDHEDSRWDNVTLRQLLSHGAGVIRDGLDSEYWNIERPFPDTDQFIRELTETGLIYDNNTQLKYTNYGYTLLGLVIEAVSGQPYNEFVLERIVRPLGLEHTFPEYRPELNQPRPAELVTGYTRREPKKRLPIAQVSTRAMSPATGFCSTAEDLCTYFTAQMVGSGKLLSDESKKEMQRPAWPMLMPGGPRDTEYGLGFVLHRYGERQTFGHSGGFPGCITDTMVDPKAGLVVTALTNAIDGPAGWILAGIYRIISFFEEHDETAPAQTWSMFEGSYANLWGRIKIVATGDGLMTVHGYGWDPLLMVEKLAFVEDEMFRIAETSSGAPGGELVHFHTEQGRVQSIRYGGAIYWPRAVWHEKMAEQTRVSF
ncbi:serine hydrolase [Alicyclobacillus acidoterrestris]|nr:serine hydrolase [Alicyclobacillus acidoterrestris]